MIYNYSPKDRCAKRTKFFTSFRGGGVSILGKVDSNYRQLGRIWALFIC